YNRACFYTAINKLDLALDDILKAIELNDFFEEYMKEDEELNAIRELERYKEMFK
ncbi:TPR end-of-group domain-containing protein, partial [Clostridium cuniculi]